MTRKVTSTAGDCLAWEGEVVVRAPRSVFYADIHHSLDPLTFVLHWRGRAYL